MNMPTAISKTSRPALCRHKTLVMLMLVAACGPVAHAADGTPGAVPDFAGQVMLIRNTLTAVNHGNITGNYTVLRDLGSERFRRRNKAGDLATTFVNLRKQARDLSPILVTKPQLTQQPVQDQYGRMRLVGYFPTRPRAVRFGLVFQKINGAWVIDEITVGVAPIESVVRPQRLPPVSPLRQSFHTAVRPDARLKLPCKAAHPGHSPWRKDVGRVVPRHLRLIPVCVTHEAFTGTLKSKNMLAIEQHQMYPFHLGGRSGSRDQLTGNQHPSTSAGNMAMDL